MATPPDTVVLVHGLWMTPLSWEHWIDRYQQRGLTVLAPAWPGFEGDIDKLRRDPSGVSRLGIAEIVDHYDGIIRGLETPPIIIGHSFGGLFVKLLLDRGLGAAGVSVHGAPPKGIPRLPLSTLRSAFPVLGNPLNLHKPVALTPKQFHYGFTNTLTAEQSQAAYERYAVPAASRVLFQGAAANANPSSPAKLDWGNADRAPLLLVAGGQDHIVPPVVTRDILKKYRKHATAVTDIVEYPARSHYTVGQDGWEEVADHALDWAIEQSASDQAT
jgi:alpha-beta hydrolase superfamily lysophospholipase